MPFYFSCTTRDSHVENNLWWRCPIGGKDALPSPRIFSYLSAPISLTINEHSLDDKVSKTDNGPGLRTYFWILHRAAVQSRDRSDSEPFSFGTVQKPLGRSLAAKTILFILQKLIDSPTIYD